MAKIQHWRIRDEKPRYYSNSPLNDNRPTPRSHTACGAAVTDVDMPARSLIASAAKPWPGMPTICPECLRLAQQATR